MGRMKTYLREKKVSFIHQFATDIKIDFDIQVKAGHGFTMAKFFYYAVVDEKKYVHKDALRFLLSNGDTYFRNTAVERQAMFNLNKDDIRIIKSETEQIFNFLRKDISECTIYPKLLDETDNFFVFEHYGEDWEHLSSLNKNDAKFIRTNYQSVNKKKKRVISPFQQDVMRSLYRNKATGEIKMVDVGKFQVVPHSKLTIFMSDRFLINTLYRLERQLFKSKKALLAPYSHGFITSNTSIVNLY